MASGKPTGTKSNTKVKGGRVRRWGVRLGLLAGSIVVASLLLELLVMVVMGEQPKFPRRVVSAPWGLRYNEPGSHYRHKSADMTTYFKINGQGMRADHDYSYEKPAGVKRIVSLGDSFTIGYEVDEDKCFSRVLERELNAAGLKVEVLNCGVSGFSNAEECLYLERELLKYHPDLVLVSFFPNDLDDNVRTGLFSLKDDQLAGGDGNYVPAGGLGDFLNRNWFFNLLSERSNAFVAIKEAATKTVKRRMNESGKAAADPSGASVNTNRPTGQDAHAYERRLTAAIFERLYGATQRAGIPLVIQSIPTRHEMPEVSLSDEFPTAEFRVDRPGVSYFAAKQALDPFVGKQQLYWNRSHSHWTPLSHELAGKELANRILQSGTLK